MNTPAFGSRTPLSTPVLQARDIIYEALLLAVGEVLTEERARERANNAATALLSLLEERGRVVAGTIEEPRSRYHFDAGKSARHLEDLEEMERHAKEVIK